MKTLVEYIRESSEEKKTVPSSKSFSFNFSGFENAEETLKSAQETASSQGVEVEVEDSTVKVTVKKDSTESAEGLFELLQDFIQLRGKDQKVASDESYAQKIHKLRDVLDDWREYVDSVSSESAEQEKVDKEEEKKEEE